MRSYFISDLHLDQAQPGSTAAFFEFANHLAVGARRLYILGDLFELWVGDDLHSELSQQVAEALRRLADGGTDIRFMAGNRDFLVGDLYAAQAGMVRIDDPTLVRVNDENVLLCHGDTLCTDDTAYQAFRQQVRQAEWQSHFLAQPLSQRQAFAEDARKKSQKLTADKPQDIMDVNESTVAETFRLHGVRTMIHGHTHRPAAHQFSLDGQPVRRIVLGAWHDRAEIAVADEQGLRLLALRP